MMQRPLPPMPLKSVDGGQRSSERPLNPVETRDFSRDLTLDEARALVGKVVADVIGDTRAALKEFGDKGAVSRWKDGKENPNLARLIASVDARKAMAKALLRSCGECVRERTVFEIEETA
jgi:hypothetical protein